MPHATRWDLPLPSLADTLGYMDGVQSALSARLDGREPERRRPISTAGRPARGHARRSFHLHSANLGQPRPTFAASCSGEADAGPLPGDVAVGGGILRLGAERDANRFVFDNEKWAHPVEIAPFRIARAPVTNAEFATFVADGGYRDLRHWDEAGQEWLAESAAEHPIYWRRDGDGWMIREFDGEAPLRPDRPVIHVNWHEARAWCRWAGRRLPTEAEWEAAAIGAREPDDSLAPTKRTYPWGEAPPDRILANLDGLRIGTVMSPLSRRATAPGVAVR